jgi:hypothetical protein
LVNFYLYEPLKHIMSNQHVLELLTSLSDAERMYAKAKSELIDIQRKLHGIPYMSCQNTNDTVSTNTSVVKRGRGRPKKNKPIVEIITTNTNNEHESILIREDSFSSAETVDLEKEITCDDVFKDATYTYINENIYIETKYGNYHDVKTKELRGWYNPYICRHEWL